MKEKEKKSDFKIPEGALEKIKSQSELDDFFSDLYKQAVEGMLKAEMDKHLGYEKHQDKEKPGDNSQQKWTMPIRSWGIILNQFIIKFEDRCKI